MAACDFKKYLHDQSSYPKIKEELRKIYGTFRNKSPITTEDYALAKSVEMAGFKGLHTLSLRHRTIGEKGHYSFSEDRWGSEGFGNIVLHDVGNVNKYTLVEA